MSLQQAAVSGIKWSSVSQGGRQLVQILTSIILARLLSPSDFGLVGMTAIVIGFITLFKDLGTSAAVIQRKDLSEQLLSSIFWVNVAFGSLAAIILLLLSPIAAIFYHEPRIVPLLKVLSLTFFISGIGILQQAILEHQLAFNRLAMIEIIASMLGSIVGIGLAVHGAGVWSLVWQSLTLVTLTTVLLWLTSTWRPKLQVNWSEVKSVSSYSLNLVGFNVFNYFARNTDYLLIGRYLGAQSLGYYTLAYSVMLYPLQNISAMIGRVMFPVFSKLQGDDDRFRHTYLKVVQTIALITFPMMIGLMALSEPFVLTVFGPQWSPVIPLLMILSPVGLLQSIGTTVGTIYQAKGRTDWMFRWGIGVGVVVMIAFIIGLRWGIIGVAAAYAAVTLPLAYPSFAIPFKLINLPVRRLLTVLWPPFVSSLVMLVALLSIKAVLPFDLSGGLILGTLVLAGIITYLLTSWLVNRDQLRQILNIAGVRTGTRPRGSKVV